MSHFAEIDQDGNVLRVIVADTKEWCEQRLGGTWVQTSYNTQKGIHKDGQTSLRKNYAGKGFKYDPIRDAFIPPKPVDTAIFNEVTCQWEHYKEPK